MIRMIVVLMVSAIAWVSPAAADISEAEKTAATIRSASCSSCHGPFGDSAATDIPRLNGQPASYLYQRLHSLRYPILESPRAIHDMGNIAPQLTSQVIAALANYYADQAPSKPRAMAGTSVEGERIYKKGAGKFIPACQSCHGARGEGSKAAPRLAGQHADYLELEMRAFALSARIADPMNRHVWMMTPEQVRAVANYLGG